MRAILDSRASGIGEQLAELIALRGKNQDVVEHMMARVKEEKELFERGLARYTALRTVFTQHTNDLFDIIGLDGAARRTPARTRQRIEDSPFTKGVRDAMGEFFARLRADFDQAGRQAAEIHDLMRAMYARFAHEHGIEIYVPPQFSVLKYLKEIERMERAYNTHFNTLWNMVSKAKYPLMKQFFETIASRARHIYKIANRDVEGWLKAVMSPLETQVREHHIQLRRRLDSVRRIHRASDELESRIHELEQAREALEAQRQRTAAAGRRARHDHRGAGRAAARRERLTLHRAATAVQLAPRSPACRACHQRFVLELQLAARFDEIRIDRDAVDRADLAALRLVEVADALGALRRVDHVDLGALRDRLVRALGLADVAVDAFVGDDQRHSVRAGWRARAASVRRLPAQPLGDVRVDELRRRRRRSGRSRARSSPK